MAIAPGIYNTGTATVAANGLTVSFQGVPICGRLFAPAIASAAIGALASGSRRLERTPLLLPMPGRVRHKPQRLTRSRSRLTI